MKKKLFALVLSFCIALSLLAPAAMADTGTETLNEPISNSEKWFIALKEQLEPFYTLFGVERSYSIDVMALRVLWYCDSTNVSYPVKNDPDGYGPIELAQVDADEFDSMLSRLFTIYSDIPRPEFDNTDRETAAKFSYHPDTNTYTIQRGGWGGAEPLVVRAYNWDNGIVAYLQRQTFTYPSIQELKEAYPDVVDEDIEQDENGYFAWQDECYRVDVSYDDTYVKLGTFVEALDAIPDEPGLITEDTLSGKGGSCGDSMSWTYDHDTQTLIISGTGEMWHFPSGFGPKASWSHLPYTKVVVKEGVTSIGVRAFSSSTVTSVVLPSTLTTISNEAFAWATVQEILIPDSVTTIDAGVFYDCDLGTVNYTGTPEQWAAISVGDYNEALASATIHYNYDPNEPIPTPTPEPTPEPTPTPAPQDKVDIPVSGDKAEATVGRVDLVLNNAGTVFAPGTVITVEAITQGSAYDTAKKALSSTGAMMDSAAVLEFTATRDGKSVQPDGSLSVTFSIPSNLSPTNLKLFYVSEDGQYQEIPITVDVDARTATAELSHFSTYVLANIAPATGGGQGSDTSDSQVPPTNEEPVPPTGDTSALPLYVCILTMAMAGLSIVLISKRKA